MEPNQLIPIALWIIGFITTIFFSKALCGLVIIPENKVGIVIKKFVIFGKNKKLPEGRIIALNGEPGYQADTLAPGWHFGYWPWQYKIEYENLTIIPEGKMVSIVANDGLLIPEYRTLGRSVDCDNFQDAKMFLENGGERGRQLTVLTAGTFRINTKLFSLVAVSPLYRIEDDMVGIVVTLDGKPMEAGRIAGPVIDGHDNFQNAQQFVNKGGCRGLQEQYLLSGLWTLNPWFVSVEQVPMTEVPIGYVGVVVSYVGDDSDDVSGHEFTHGNIVKKGGRGVWDEPLYPGKYAINTRIMKVELVPTTNIVLNWATKSEAHAYDDALSSITVRSKDGFSFNLDVSQIIHVGAKSAPLVISRVGSMKNLVEQVLEPIIGNYFRNASQNYTVLDFLSNREERQAEVGRSITRAIESYNVKSVDTLIGDINPPKELMDTLIARKVAAEQQKTFETQELAEKQRQSYQKEKAIADIQSEIVKADQGVIISQKEADARVEKARGDANAKKLIAKSDAEARALQGEAEATSIKAVGEATAESYEKGVNAIGDSTYGLLQMIKSLSEGKVKLTPDILVSGTAGKGNTISEALIAQLMLKMTKKPR